MGCVSLDGPILRRPAYSPAREHRLGLRPLPLIELTSDASTRSTTRRQSQSRWANAWFEKRLPKRPTARDAMLAVAALGGHLKSNGDPGGLVLGRGMHDCAGLPTR